MKRMISLFLFLAAVTSLASAQTNTPPPPPPVLLIVREEMKPGKLPAHEQEARQFVYVQSRANSRLPAEMRDGRLAMSPIAGNENEVTYLSAYGSFADMEAKRKEFDKLSTGAMKADFEALPNAELHAAQTDVLARYRPDLSSGIGRVDVAQARYMSITTLRLKPGTEDDYWNTVKRVTWPAREKAGDTGSYAAYQVSAGAPAVTYLILRPMRSLGEMDAPGSAVRNAMGEGGRNELDKMRDKSVLLSNTSIYMFNPRLSIVSREFAARDSASPAFWITDPQMPATAAMPDRRVTVKRTGKQ